MTILSAGDIRTLARDAVIGQGIAPDLADELVAEFVAAELAGRGSHGLGKLAAMRWSATATTPDLASRGPVLTVDGRGGIGLLVMRTAARELVRLAGEHHVAIAAVRNISRYGALYPYTEILAGAGLVGILMNNAGPAAVAPFGSIDPITGTNPVCFSFPTAAGPQSLDLSTAEVTWGEIRQATLERRGLPDGPFLDAAGQVTTTPADVNAVRAFGGAKGWALNLAIEVLAGALVGAKSGLAVEDEFDCGALMIAVDPAATASGNGLPAAVAGLFDEVRAARPEHPGLSVRAPGDQRRARPPDETDVAATTVDLLHRLASGATMHALTSDPLMN